MVHYGKIYMGGLGISSFVTLQRHATGLIGLYEARAFCLFACILAGLLIELDDIVEKYAVVVCLVTVMMME